MMLGGVDAMNKDRKNHFLFILGALVGFIVGVVVTLLFVPEEREEIFRKSDIRPRDRTGAPKRKAGVKPVEVSAGRISVPLEAYCFKCRAKREMKDPIPVVLRNGRPATKGICAVCGTKMFRLGKAG
jgi:hypothetical protein